MDLSILLFEKRFVIFSAIAGNGVNTTSEISRSTNTSYSYVYNTLKMLERCGLITRFKSWNRHPVELNITNKGVRVWKDLQEVKRIIE